MTRSWILAAIPLWVIIPDLGLGAFLRKHSHTSDGVGDAFSSTESDAYRIANGEDEEAQDDAGDDTADEAEEDAGEVDFSEGEAEGDQTMEERLASHRAEHSKAAEDSDAADSEAAEDSEAAADSADSEAASDTDDDSDHDSNDNGDLDRVDPADAEEDEDDQPAMLQKTGHGHRSGVNKHAAAQYAKVNAVYDPIHGDQARFGMYDFAHMSSYGDNGGGISVLDATAARHEDRQIIAERDDALQRDEEDASRVLRARERETEQGPAVSAQGLDEPEWG